MNIVRFAKKVNLNLFITFYNEIYAVQSEYHDVVYCISDGWFAVLRSDGAVYVPIADTPKLAEKMVEPIKKEILGIYGDILESGIDRNIIRE